MPDRTAGSRMEPEVAHGTTGSNRSRGRGLLALSNWPLRAKLVAVFLLPTVAALFLVGLRVMDGLTEANVYERALERMELSDKVATLVHEVQGERMAMSAWIVAGRPGDRRALNAAIEQTSAAADELRAASQEVEQLEDPATTDLYKQAIARLDSLGELRSSARDPDFPAPAVVVSYNVLTDALLDVSGQFGAEVSDKGLQQRHEALSTLGQAKEFSARQNTYLRNAAIRGDYKPTEMQGIVRARSNLVTAIADYDEVATARHRSLYQSTVSGEAVSTRFQLQALSLQRARASQPVDVDPAAVNTSSTTTLRHIRTVQEELLADTTAYTKGLLDSVRQELITTSIVLIATLAIALTLMIVVARSMLRPLRELRTNALQVAERHLPEAVEKIMHESDPRQAAEQAIAPVPVHTEEEVGQVARAFDVVHGQAVRLAAEQALLRENVNGIFVNLSRRSQRLVERQLGVIDRLESDEQDPDQLASLFELDHLATRLRRNGESLLVLSGAGLAKSLSKPVPAADVVGAAVSEIEQYSRVEIGAVPQVAVRGNSVHDLVHLLAELFDNATYFSEPETKITVRAVVTRRKALAIQITDRGVGMTDTQITEANERLADPPDLDVSVTRRMGLYVVARLAQRHGIEVRLRENEDIDGGVIARVVVPQELLEDVSGADSSLTPPPANDQLEPQRQPALEQTVVSGGTTGPHGGAAAGYQEPTHVEPAYQEPAFAGAGYPEPAWPREADTHAPHPGAVPAQAGAGSPDENGLIPLDEPISLDDLVAGTSAAGPFAGPDDQSEPERALPERGQRDWPSHERPQAAGNGTANGSGDADTGAGHPLAVPRAQPRYVPVTGEDPKPRQPVQEAGPTETAALEDDVPTRRLPIYQSVLSRWFSEEQPLGGADPAAQGQHRDRDREQERDASGTDGWASVSDAGWEAADSLLRDGDEEVTEAGLPKRVPNAYLVPGSVQPDAPGEPPGFTDTTSSHPGQPAIARSAEEARSRMMNFQRGYTRGRHALHNDTADRDGTDAAGVNVAGERSAENGVKE